MAWRWSNVPVPEIYVGPLVVAIIVQLIVPLKIFFHWWIGHLVGWPTVAVGTGLIIWAVRTVGGMDISKPTGVISSGPYRFGRNPMYLAWTLISLSVALIVNSLWLVILLPVVLLFTHFVMIPSEERDLESKFGDDYVAYKTRVRRWL